MERSGKKIRNGKNEVKEGVREEGKELGREVGSERRRKGIREEKEGVR